MCMEIFDIEEILNETRLCVDIIEHISGEIFEYANPIGESAHTKEENMKTYCEGRYALIMNSNMLIDYILSLKEKLLEIEEIINLYSQK